MAGEVAARSFKEQFSWQPTDKLLLTLRQLMAVLDATLLPLLESKREYDNATTETRQLILQRFNLQIQPLFDEIVAAAQLGVIFTSTSSTPGDNTLGLKGLTLNEVDRNRFAAAAYLTAMTMDGSAGISGRLRSYSRATGLLVIEPLTFFGSPNTAITSWLVTAGADTYAYRQYVDTAVAASVAQIRDNASTAIDTFREVELALTGVGQRITALIGTADGFGDTLGELQATANTDRQAAADRAIQMAIALG